MAVSGGVLLNCTEVVLPAAPNRSSRWTALENPFPRIWSQTRKFFVRPDNDEGIPRTVVPAYNQPPPPTVKTLGELAKVIRGDVTSGAPCLLALRPTDETQNDNNRIHYLTNAVITTANTVINKNIEIVDPRRRLHTFAEKFVSAAAAAAVIALVGWTGAAARSYVSLAWIGSLQLIMASQAPSFLERMSKKYLFGHADYNAKRNSLYLLHTVLKTTIADITSKHGTVELRHLADICVALDAHRAMTAVLTARGWDKKIKSDLLPESGTTFPEFTGGGGVQIRASRHRDYQMSVYAMRSSVMSFSNAFHWNVRYHSRADQAKEMLNSVLTYNNIHGEIRDKGLLRIFPHSLNDNTEELEYRAKLTDKVKGWVHLDGILVSKEEITEEDPPYTEFLRARDRIIGPVPTFWTQAAHAFGSFGHSALMALLGSMFAATVTVGGPLLRGK